MNNVSPLVIDWWTAHYTLKLRRESEAYNNKSETFDPSDASEMLKSRTRE